VGGGKNILRTSQFAWLLMHSLFSEIPFIIYSLSRIIRLPIKSKLKLLGQIKGKYLALLKIGKQSIPTLTTNNKSRTIRMNVNGKEWPP